MSKQNRVFTFFKRTRDGSVSDSGRDKKRSSDSHSQRNGRRGSATRVAIGVVLTLILVVSGGYLTVSAIRLSRGITKTVPAPSRFMRLQVVDGTGGERQEFTRIADKLAQLSDSVLEITVIDRIAFVTRAVERSIVISREDDLTSAKMLATKLGIDPGEVESAPLEDNSTQATATLVIGKDLISDPALFSAIKKKALPN